MPLITLYIIFAPLNFVVSFISLVMAFFTLTIGGITNIFYAEDTNVKILLEKKIAAMETVTEEKLEVLAKSIENFKEKGVVVQDKKTTKSLIRELILIYKSAEKALAEKQDLEKESLKDISLL